MTRYLLFEKVSICKSAQSSLQRCAQSFRSTFSNLGSVGSFGLMVIVSNSRFELFEPILSWCQDDVPLLTDEPSLLRPPCRRSAMS
jgi:hypothetical protein